MPTAMQQLQERVANLERETMELKARFEGPGKRPWWDRVGDPPPDSEVYKEYLRILEQQSDADKAAVCAELDREGRRSS